MKMRVLLFSSVLVAFSYQACLNSGDPTAVNLSFCTEYNTSACCTVEQDQLIEQNYVDIQQRGFGSGGCAENIKAFLCAAGCSPDQSSFSSSSNGVTTVNLDNSFANGIYESCKNICLKGVPLQQAYSTPAQQLALYNDNSTVYSVASSGGFNHSVLPATDSDLVPCTCPLVNGSAPEERSLTFCPQYSNSGCCTVDQDLLLQARYNHSVPPFFGYGGCAENFRRLLCSFTCSPQQADFSVYQRGNPSNLTVYVAQAFVDELFNTCQNVCLPFAGGILVKSRYANSAKFIALLDSKNDNSYVPSESQPVLNYVIGKHPITGASFSTSTVPASATDSAGCGANDGSPSEDSKSTGSSLKILILLNMLLLMNI